MNQHQLLQHSKKWDRVGLAISILCIIHCIILPFILLFMPWIHLLNGPFIESLLLASGALVGGVSFWTSFKKHRQRGPLLLGLIGVGFLIFSIISIHSLDHQHALHSNLPIGKIDFVTVTGGLFLIAGHVWNIRACHCFCDNSCEHEHHHP